MQKHIGLWSLVLMSALGSSTALAYRDPLVCAVVVPSEREHLELRAPIDSANDPEAVCMPERPAPRRQERPAWSEPLSPDEARASLDAADRALQVGELGDALLHLRVVELGVPRIADRVALQRGDVLLALGQPAAACEAYALASDSPSRDTAVRGQVGAVRCLLEAGDHKSENALRELMRRYPQLSQRSELQYLFARARAGWGNLHSAAALLRAIDLNEPESEVAARARIELERLRALGVRPYPFSIEERVDRAERLLARGPLEVAEQELLGLAAEAQIRGEQLARVHLLIARLLRLQGRWDALRVELERARKAGAPFPEATRLAVNAVMSAGATVAITSVPVASVAVAGAPSAIAADTIAPTLAAAVVDPNAEELSRIALAYEKRVRSIRGSKTTERLTTPQVRLLFDLAFAHGDKTLADDAIVALASRKALVPGLRFDLAMRSIGLASDDKVLALLEPLLAVPSYRVPALYHHARMLERLGRKGEAEAEYLRVSALDRSETRYYAMWSQQRLSTLHPGIELDMATLLAAGESDPAETEHDPIENADANAPTPVEPTSAAVGAAEPVVAAIGPVAASDRMSIRLQAAAKLRPIAEQHGAAYPWLLRALDLIELERFEEAADELSEAYMAYRDVKGAPRLRAGLFAVYTGGAPPRRFADFPLRKARLALDRVSLGVLREVTVAIGDPGIGLRFGVFSPTARPRAYADLVEAAARRNGVDPNLLFAVMRVESIFNRRIVSYAGAVGLMQIMPHTGRRIALKLGRTEFQVSDLLDPATNLEMSAWYLASLLRRFDGRLPLAIASYNGGPHNVRLWMRGHQADMPLDAFLERIPFSQTHRYVRRVLTHYAAYRAQQSLPMRELSLDLPTLKPDPMAF